MEFLKETDLLKIEDILPFFPDFVLMGLFICLSSSLIVDNFREAVTTSLRQYNMDIDELQEEVCVFVVTNISHFEDEKSHK